MKRFRTGMWLILGVIVVLSLSSVPAKAAIIFSDDFNAENGGVADISTLNYTVFANWAVSSGTVDLIGNAYYDFYPGNGLYVDLDGTTGDAGTMTSIGLPLGPGQYELKFWLGGNARGYPADTVAVSVAVGGVSQSYTLSSGAFLAEYSMLFTIGSATTANIVFDHAGGDNQGIILDQVVLNQIPEPGTLILLGSGLLGLVVAGRKKFRK